LSNKILIEIKKPLFIIRLGLAIVFLWFGISKILQPESWIAWLPTWIEQLPISTTTHLILQGIAEAILGVLLLLGLFTRLAAAIAAILLVAVIITIGYNDIAIRDLAILSIAIALFFNKHNPLSLDNRRT
jgi:uncharacterized membrane protein YphA (DoxX/SURF4 family)